MSNLVRYDVADRVAVLTIDNPPVNALSPAVWEALDEAVARAAADPGVDATVLIGAGSTFIAGADIKVFETLKTREQSLERSGDTHALLKRLEDAPKPLVAAIHGNALGGGNEVAMACHYRVATRDAKDRPARSAARHHPRRRRHAAAAAALRARRSRSRCAPTASRFRRNGRSPAASSIASWTATSVTRRSRSRGSAPPLARLARRASGPTRRQTSPPGLRPATDARRRWPRPRRRLAAPYAAVDAIEAGLQLPFDAGSLRERELFADCVVSTESKALRHLFFAEREAAKVPRRAQGHAGARPSRARPSSAPAPWAAASR